MESALDKVKMIEDMGYDNLVVSIKSSDVLMCAKAHELLAPKCPYPLHVGITEAGTLFRGNIKSAIGLGIILNQGIGDTIRVSLTGNPVNEIASAKQILKTLGLRKGGVEVVSCPTCGRTNIDLIGLANEVEKMVTEFDDLDIKVAVMGCVVNGPGEAKEADIGIAGGKGEGLLIKKGQVVRKLPESELLSTLREELAHWNESRRIAIIEWEHRRIHGTKINYRKKRTGKNGISGAGSNPPFHGKSAAEILCNRTRAVQS